jgi:hypothetical protein
MSKKQPFFFEYQYAIGLILGLLMGAWLKEEVFLFISVLIAIIIAERLIMHGK